MAVSQRNARTRMRRQNNEPFAEEKVSGTFFGSRGPGKEEPDTFSHLFHKIEAVREKDPSQKQRIELRDLKVDYGLEHVFEGVQE